MKKILSISFILLIVLAGSVNSFAAEEQMKDVLAELKKMTKELSEIKIMMKNVIQGSRGRQRPSEAVISIDDDPMMGEVDAKVTIVEFTDYQCPWCKKFSDETLNKIKEEYILTGKVRYVLRDLVVIPGHTQAKKAAQAASCANEQGKYWKMHDLLYENQRNLSVEMMKGFARDLGLNSFMFNQCLDSGKYEEEIEKDIKDAMSAGLSGTPAFVVGRSGKGKTFKGKIISGARPFEFFKQVIDEVLKSP